MVCEEWKDSFKNLFSGKSPDQGTVISLPEDLKAHLDICAQCRKTYQTIRLLENGTELQKSAPAYLTRRINTVITERKMRLKTSRLGYALVPLTAAVLFALFAVFTLLLFTPRTDLVRVHLVLKAADAESVAVVGDWNGWDPHADLLSDENADGVWEIELHLSPEKEYRYQFFIDGTKWVPDPNSELTVEDGFGGINSVLDI